MKSIVVEWMTASANPTPWYPQAQNAIPSARQPTSKISQTQTLTYDPQENPDLCLYRDRTLAILRRYLRMALQTGRLPSLLGREFFRSQVTSYRAQTFEDAVVFVHDVERSLELLDDWDKNLIVLTVLRDHTQEEAARLLGCSQRTIERRYGDAVDRVSHIFLDREILERLPETVPVENDACQPENKRQRFATDSI